MTTQLIDHNEDLCQLKKDGYNVSIVNNNLVVKGIPYVNQEKQVQFGTIYCPLTLSGSKAVAP